MSLFRRIKALGSRSKIECEIADELNAHIELRIADDIAAGMSPEQARRDALLRFGNPTVVKENVTAVDAALSLGSTWADLRYAIRGFYRNPGFAFVAVATLALCTGANTAIFQLIDAVRLRSLPIHHPQELTELRIAGGNHDIGINSGPSDLTGPIWQELRKHHEPLSGIFAWRKHPALAGLPGFQAQVRTIQVSGEFFSVLGINPQQGRLILPEDEASSCTMLRAVVSYAYWKGQMGGRDLTPASQLVINGQPVQVIGVTPAEFPGLSVGDTFDLALPLCEPLDARRDLFDLSVMGRLQPGWTWKRASAYFDALSLGIFDVTAPTGYSPGTVNTFKQFRLGAYPASGGVSQLREKYDKSLGLLLAISGLVLLIGCVNLANLLLARADTRKRQIAVRLALGAPRGRIVQQLLIENGLLAVFGAVSGIFLARAFSRVLVSSLSTQDAPVDLSLATDWRVLLFAMMLAAVTCAIFGTLPTLQATKADPLTAMKTSRRGLIGSSEGFSAQRLAAVVQISLSLVLLVSALLFVRSFRNLVTFDPGMRESGITYAWIGFDASDINPEHYAEFKEQLLQEVSSLPGVKDAATTTLTPLVGGSWEHGVEVGETRGNSKFTWISPTYFQTMGIPLVKGRSFNESDTADSPHVVIVNQTFSRQFLNGADPLGQTLRTMPEPNYPAVVFQIVGVIPDTKYNDIREAIPPMAFAPASQYPVNARGPWTMMMIRSDSPAAVGAAIKCAMARNHPEIMTQFWDFQQQIRDRLVRERLMALLASIFGVLAAVLAATGLYGLLAYMVASRRNEIGIRIALGASRRRVIGLVMRDAGWMLVVGIPLGIGLSLLAGRAANSMLFEIKPYDPMTFIFAAGLMVAIAALASFVPARRAAALDAMQALRED